MHHEIDCLLCDFYFFVDFVDSTDSVDFYDVRTFSDFLLFSYLIDLVDFKQFCISNDFVAFFTISPIFNDFVNLNELVDSYLFVDSIQFHRFYRFQTISSKIQS